MQLIFATANQHKLKEVRAIAPPGLEILGLKDLGFEEEAPETQITIEGNSLQKAEYVSLKFGRPCFSEDTGMEVYAINNEPGVYSARYAGKGCTSADNVAKVLQKMTGETKRRARFKTVITYYSGGQYVQFEGITEGEITETPKGAEGFGYDPIFKPDGSDKTYAEMSLEEKNGFSHRRKSFELFANHLKQIAV
ncbi:MAG TPA: RdgB/HAM1 family non-canonical purine NTP pyrophosphatase [Chitinophagales bacterium]|nr:RdgB/HAM1 family non-canonical purine NTP pyrophosphatase [Chitinophagales bacterium]